MTEMSPMHQELTQLSQTLNRRACELVEARKVHGEAIDRLQGAVRAFEEAEERYTALLDSIGPQFDVEVQVASREEVKHDG